MIVPAVARHHGDILAMAGAQLVHRVGDALSKCRVPLLAGNDAATPVRGVQVVLLRDLGPGQALRLAVAVLVEAAQLLHLGRVMLGDRGAGSRGAPQRARVDRAHRL